MCHVNLDMKQAAVERKYGKKLDLAVYYLSDVVGLALGLSGEQLGIDRHFRHTRPCECNQGSRREPRTFHPGAGKNSSRRGSRIGTLDHV